ncbi:autophagy- protein 2 [Coemansia erecta]|uniref:Autophagy-related protein 2 n=1 Tax=Coemansia erecta TaxID=147472 RepID=A0A9W8CVC5_9FUNG|nr:autophagy- protein 2 [Coemansia erecta]
MPSWAVSNSLQKRLVKFLLRRTVGQFLKTELDDENLDVQLSGGQLRLKNVQLSEEALNDAIIGLPVVVRSGVIGAVSISIPWTQLWTGHCELQIDDLEIKTQLSDGDDYNGSLNANSGDDSEEAERQRLNKAHLAESVVMTDGGASILASSVFIADDFLRAETLGYGPKDDAFINKDVERLVADAHEERVQYYRSQSKAAGSNQPGQGSAPANDANDGDKFEDCIDDLPLPTAPGSGSVHGLQVVSEMVDRIISAVNIRVRNINVECLVVARDEHSGETTRNTIKLSVSSIDFVEERGNPERSSGPSTESSSPRRQGSSGDVSGDNANSVGSGSDRDHPVGIEYKVVEFRTLFKLLEIRGLRVSLVSDTSDGVSEAPVLSTFASPMAAHIRIHRRMPFSELAPVAPKSGGNDGSRRKSAGTGEALYMGPMPGEFREARPPSPQYLSDANQTFSRDGSGRMDGGTRMRNHLGEDAKTSGWDVAIDMTDMACVLTRDQLASILAIARTAAPLLKLKSDRQEMRTRYQQKFGDRLPDTIAASASAAAAAAATSADAMAGIVPELARWVSAKLKHIYVAVVPQPTELLDGWQDSSLAVLRLKLETVKHLAFYLKNVGARWECTPVSGTRSAPGGSSAHVDTELWAAMSHEAANRGVPAAYTEDVRQPMASDSKSTTMVSAYIQSVSVYDNDPELHPVVRPLVTIDRSMDITKHQHQQQHQQHAGSRRAARNSEKYDVWMCAFESDPVLTVNVGPIVFALNKELADRLGLYQELLSSVVLAAPAVPSSGANAYGSRDAYTDDVTDSIENLMRNLKISAEQKMPSNVAVCSPLIRTWILLPGTVDTGSSKESMSGSQIRSRGSKDDLPVPGHFCVDAIDAVITNVVNGTATSSQTQNDVPDGHLRHPHIQELLESRKSVAGSGVRVECESLHVYLQSMEGSSAIDHIASIHAPSVAPLTAFSGIAVPRPHVEITTVAKNSGRRTPAYKAAEQFGRRPPAFDAFSAVDDNIRVRMAPESELSTSLKFERLAVALSSLVVSCHLPETEILLTKTTYQRLNAVINDFLLWQSIQEEARAASRIPEDIVDVPDDKAELGLSVLVDMPLMVARVNTSDQPYYGRADISSAGGGDDRSHRIRLTNSQGFLSNAIIEKGRMYVTLESNQVRLSSFIGEAEIGAVLSHTFATPESQILTPQLSLYMLTSPTITEESEIVLKTSWTTVDYESDSTCLRDLEAFFGSPGTSGLVQPPPKPARLSLNVQNSSLTWTPSRDPSISGAALSLDSLAVIIGINTPAPARDREELHYYVEGLSVFGKSRDSLAAVATVDMSSDAWVSTRRFWVDHGYTVLVHMDMVDVASRMRDGEDGPLVDLKLYSEALVLDACADSVGSLPLLLQSLVADIAGSSKKQDPDAAQVAPAKRSKRVVSPQILGQVSGGVFDDIEENTFSMPAAASSAPRPISIDTAYRGRAHSLQSNAMSPHMVDDFQNSFTYDFENGHDDISALAMDEYFAPHTPPDVADEYEVVGGGQALSPTSTVHPMYSRRSNTQHQQHPHQQPHMSPGHRQPLDIQRSKGKTASRNIAAADGGIGRSSSYSFGDDEDDEFDLGDYVNMDSDGDILSEGDEFEHRTEYGVSNTNNRLPRLESRFSDQQQPFANVEDSVVLEPDYSASSHGAKRLSTGIVFPNSRILDDDTSAYGGVGNSFRSSSNAPVRITVPSESGDSIGDAGETSITPSGDGSGGKFELIEDYFKVPAVGDTTDDDSGSVGDSSDHIICVTIDLARVEVNLHSGHDWYVSADQPVHSSPIDPGYLPSYMDTLDDADSESPFGRVSASMPESRGPIDFRNSPLGSPHKQPGRQPGRPARRSAKPKIELRATHVHAEYKQYSETSTTAYDLGLNIGMIEILDQLESSEWSKFLTRRRDAKTGLPLTLHTLATTRNRELLTKGTADSDRVTSGSMRRQRSSRWPDSNSGPMIYAQIEAVRPYTTLPTEELRVDFEISPLRCYIHQDALDFLIGFFESAEQHSAMLAEIERSQNQASTTKGATSREDATRGGGTRERRLGIYRQQKTKAADQLYFQIVHMAPINVIFDYKPRRMRAVSGSGGSSSSKAAKASSGNGGASPSLVAANAGSSTAATAAASGSSSRKPVELLNFFPLEDAEMTLNTVKVRGVAGVSKLVRELAGAWLPHLTQTQIPGVVSGMTPLRSLVNIGSGVADLVILPLEQYRKDGRLVQGIKRGAQSFARTTALEAIQLGAKVAVNAQTLLEQAGDILNVDVVSAGDSSSNPHSHESRTEGSGALSPYGGDQPHIVLDMADWPDYMSADGYTSAASASVAGDHGGSARRGSFNKSKYARQPENLSEGMRQAYMSLRSNVGDAMQTILAIPVVVQEGTGEGGDGDESSADGGSMRSPVHGSVRAVVRAVPVAVLKPMIGATEAVSKTLLGLRNTMEPSRRGQLEDKYKSRSLGAKKSYPS